MSFVSEVLLNSVDDPPDDQVLNWLMERLTFNGRTRRFSVFDTTEGIDPTYTLRSYLLQQLLNFGR